MPDPLSAEPPTRDGYPGSGPELTQRQTRTARPPVQYRSMGADDLAFVVEQHLHHFPDGFFARLGPRFLREYYRGFLTGPSARTAVAEVDGQRVGYLVGVTEPGAHRDHVVRRHGRRLALRAAAAMLLHPALAFLFLRTRTGLYTRKLLRRRRRGPAAPASSSAAGRAAVLSHVAIEPSAQARGIGSSLIQWFQRQVAEAGCDRLTLVTASGDDGAGPYYRRRGWTAVGERCTPDGLWLTTYERPVAGRPRAEQSRSEDSA
jgi:ribosomal protein S18 acetylase RimI-like enzyme